MAEIEAQGSSLPSLNSRLRGGREAIAKAGLTILQEVFGLGLDALAKLPPDVLAALTRAARPEDRERDEAYADLLQLPSVAAGTGLTPDFLEQNLIQEVALGQMDAAGSRAALGISDAIRLVRTGLYATNGENEARLTELAGSRDLDPGLRLSLTTTFAEALRQEGLLQARGAETRRLTDEQELQLAAQLDQLDQSAEERDDIENLLQAARDPGRAFPSTPRSRPER